MEIKTTSFMRCGRFFFFFFFFFFFCFFFLMLSVNDKTEHLKGNSALLNCIFRMNPELLFTQSVQCLDMFDVYFCILAPHTADQLWKPEDQQSCSSAETSGPGRGQTIYE